MYFGKPILVTESLLASSNVAETVAAWSAATYAEGAQVRRAKNGIQRIFTSAQSGNTNHDPATDDGTWWTPGPPTNRYAMFDQSRGSQTSNAEAIVVQIPAPGLVNTLSLQNVDADTVRIVQTDLVEGVVYDETFRMVSNSGIRDPWAYATTPITRIADLTLIELKPYANSTLTVTVSNPGGVARCGECVPAWLRRYGGTRWGGTVGIVDYSIKDPDDFGSFDPIERGYSKRVGLQVLVDPAMVDTVVDDLSKQRAKATLFVGDQDYGALALVGFVKDWSVELGPTIATLNIDIESFA